MLQFIAFYPRARDFLGFIPHFLDADDPAPAREQFGKNYVHGGWNPFEGFTLRKDKSLKYPGDPAFRPVAMAKLRDETIYVYAHAWVMIEQADGTWEVARLD